LQSPKPKEDAKFTITVKDTQDKSVGVGGEDVKVAVTTKNGKLKGTPSVKDNGDGTYSVVYLPDKAGDYNVETLLNGKPIKNSPVKVTVNNVVDPSKTKVSGIGVTAPVALRKAPFVVDLRDAEDKPISDSTVEAVVKVVGGDPLPITYNKLGDGKTEVVYAPKKPVDLEIQLLVDGKPFGQPYHVKAKPSASAKKSALTRWTFTIICKDEDGNPLVEEDKDLVVHIKAPDNKTIDAKLTNNANGEYLVEYSPSMKGEYIVSVTIEGEHIVGSPFKHTHN